MNAEKPSSPRNGCANHNNNDNDDMYIGDEAQCKPIFASMVQAAYAAQNKKKRTSHFIMMTPNTARHRQYVPPEITLGDAYDYYAETVWVLGITLYRMLVGRFPFSATDDAKLVNKMLHGDFSIPSHLSTGKKKS